MSNFEAPFDGMALAGGFSAWAQASDVRKRDLFEAPVAPRHGGMPFFSSPGPLAQENLDLFAAITFQRHEEAAHNTSKKLRKTELEHAEHRLSHIFVFKLDLGGLLKISTPKVPGLCIKL